MDKYLKIKNEFEKSRDNENAVKMSKYMRNMFHFYGLSTPERKQIYKDLLKEDKARKYFDEYREFQYLVMDYLISMQKFLTYDDVPKIKKYIKTNPQWVKKFIEKYKDRMDKLSIREASKYI